MAGEEGAADDDQVVDNPQIDDEIAALVDRMVDAKLDAVGQMVDRVKSLLDQQGQDAETVARQAVAIIQEQASAEAHELRGRLAASQNGHGEAEIPAAESTDAGKPDTPVATFIRGIPVDTVLGIVDKLFDRLEKVADVRLKRADPIRFAQDLSETNPLLAQFIGGMLAPDPMEAQIPGMMADTAKRTFDQGYRMGVANAGGVPASPRRAGSRSRPQNPLPPTTEPTQELPSESSGIVVGQTDKRPGFDRFLPR